MKPLKMRTQIFGLVSLTIILQFYALSLKAQENPAKQGPWSLQECIDYGIQNNLEVQRNQLTIRSQENTLMQSKVERAPRVNAFANQAFNWGRSIDPFTNDFVNQRVNSNNFSLQADVTIFDGFRNANRIKQNQINVESSRLDMEQSRNNASLNIALSYLQVLQNKELLKVAEQQVASTQLQLDRTQKLFDAGAVAENDVIDLKSQLANDQLAVINAQNQIDIAKVQLQQSMNLPVDSNFDVIEVDINQVGVTGLNETPQQVYEAAENSQPNIRSADLAIESSSYAVDLAKANFYPTLTLSGSVFTGYSSATRRFETSQSFQTQVVGQVEGTGENVISTFPVTNAVPTSYPFLDQLGDNLRQQVALSLTIPIFNRYQNRTQVENSIITQKTSEINARNVRQQLRQTIEQAYVDARSALNTFEARQKQVEALELSFDITEKRYNAGAANIVDYNLARINRDNARSDLIRAKYDYLFRQKVLDFYMGKPLDIK